ncbi:MAG: DNA-processing protein DprA [Solirubrobacteraceae bacterium]
METFSVDREGYPPRLRGLDDAPGELHVRGDPSLLYAPRIAAILGTRMPSACGLAAARRLAAALARAGWTVLSGLAQGIDAAAHASVVELRSPTIAVLGCGLGRVDAIEGGELAKQIVRGGGALVSEQPHDAPALRSRLTARDRIQTALAHVVIVAQSDLGSGTMHSVRFAALQGRPVLCHPPCDESPASAGCALLLERPARELCSLLPAWAGAEDLCATLGDRPVAEPVSLDDVVEKAERLAAAAR